MDKPFAITLDVGSSLANHTGTWRAERPVYVTCLPPCATPAPPGRTSQRWLYAAEDGATRRPGAQLMAVNPFPAVMGRVCYHPCETACNRAQPRRGGRHQLGRAVPRRRGASGRAGRFRRPRRRPDGGCWSWAPGPPGCRRRTTCACWATT